jgi:large subunit ribosomal protein L3
MDRQVKGILGAKLGMTQVWDNNKVVPVTVVQAGPCVVTQVRTADKDGYAAVQLAYGAIDPRKANKPVAGHYAKAEPPVASSRACGWPAGWVASGTPCRT